VPTDPLLDELLDVALVAARGAAAVLQDHFGQVRADVRTKSSPTDMVSEVDREAEARITAILAERRPDDGLLGEEGAFNAGTTGVRWLVDPLDGTTNYLFGVPSYCVSIAAELDGAGVVGVVVDPSRAETWSAAKGDGAFLNGRPIGLDSESPPLDQALIATGFSYLPDRRAWQARRLTGVLPLVRDIRRFGSAALDLCWVAGGRVNGYYEWGLQPWDLAAGAVIATEAGAVVDTLPDDTVLCAPPGLLGALRALLEAAAGRQGAVA
jgi:fructose-1,6-bisphosphatase/inositol monophosphatase family enzyme